MKMKRKTGIITPFAAVSIVLIISLMLVLLEGTRMRYGEKLCAQQAQYAAQTFLGQYHVKLLERFGIYGVDEQMYENKKQFLANVGAFRTGTVGGSFLNPESNDVETLTYRLLTDDGGADFRKQAVTSYLYHLPEIGLDRLEEQLSLINGLGNEQTEEDIINSANEAIEEAKRRTEDAQEAQRHGEHADYERMISISNRSMKTNEETENPIETMKRQKASFVIDMVLPDGFSLSNAAMSQDSRLEDRSIESGTMNTDTTSMINEKLLFPLYLSETFQHALSDTKKAEEGGLQYQLEYFVIGADSDVENLEGVIQSLILVREMTWFAYRLTDGTSMPAARSIATALACGLAVPMLIEPIAMAIVLAWAYTDAVQDVKALLAGKEISLIPRENIKENTKGNGGERTDVKSAWMLDYADFLLLLLAIKNTDTVTFRALDMVQESLILAGYDFTPEKTITGIEGIITYNYEELFLGWVVITCPTVFPAKIESEFRESYCP